MTYTADKLQTLFSSKFDLKAWIHFLDHLMQAEELRVKPEPLGNTLGGNEGYYLGQIETLEGGLIGLFYYKVQGDVRKKTVGLRRLVQSFTHARTGLFEAALVVFDDGTHWRLSFVCDIKDRDYATAPRRFSFVFGEENKPYRTPIERFLKLQKEGISFAHIREAFSVEALTRSFYQELFAWYLWAISPEAGVTFPNDTRVEDDDREDIEIKVIRLITRVMFVWFIKQKALVPNKIFDLDSLRLILKDFDPESTTSGEYYNAILQNLFFATLNRAIEDEEGQRRGFAQAKQKDIKTLYRYAEMFAISEAEVIELFAEVPFLNGGLFECLDKTKQIDGVEAGYNLDGFSRNDKCFADGRYKHRAVVPNVLFFEPERGLFSILSRYNFTIVENSPEEQQIALEPELLGKVFENLLGAYNPETKETARNESGSFYTPRELVQYMVDESLIAYLGGEVLAREVFAPDFVWQEQDKAKYERLATQLKSIKVLDPACGSGAFPMGLLSRMLEILERLDGGHELENSQSYALKLELIKNCIYGCDIQPIATQITKLRFFITLICDCERDMSLPNFGIPTLPNLETKFVTANSLISIKQANKFAHSHEEDVQQQDLFGDAENNPIVRVKQNLIQVRNDHFMARSAKAKMALRHTDERLRLELKELLELEGAVTTEDIEQIIQWNPYDQNASAGFLAPQWMLGVSKFDLVIGNPPYIQLQANSGALANLYKDAGFETFVRSGDIYTLFYERAYQLLKAGGLLCFVTSNKWMRASYGSKLRGFLTKQTTPLLLVDFAGVKIFESATVDVNILLFEKGVEEPKPCRSAVIGKQGRFSLSNLSQFIQQHEVSCSFAGEESWVILSAIEQSIKRKIEAVGKPLKEWDIHIYRGVLTGCNEAFVITAQQREEILASCRDEAERARTEALIRPILRGRDIKRYSYDWAELWIIYAHNGVKGKIPRVDIEDYPTIKEHFNTYWDKIADRTDQGDTPYNLRNCAYMEDFDKPKIIYPEICSEVSFALDSNKYIIGNTAYLITPPDLETAEHFLRILNTKLMSWYYKSIAIILGEKAFRLLSVFVQEIPIPPINSKPIEEIFGLTDEEIFFIENN